MKKKAVYSIFLDEIKICMAQCQFDTLEDQLTLLS